MLLRDLQAETLWWDITHWIIDPASPLPSGAEKRARKRLASGVAKSGERAGK